MFAGRKFAGERSCPLLANTTRSSGPSTGRGRVPGGLQITGSGLYVIRFCFGSGSVPSDPRPMGLFISNRQSHQHGWFRAREPRSPSESLDHGGPITRSKVRRMLRGCGRELRQAERHPLAEMASVLVAGPPCGSSPARPPWQKVGPGTSLPMFSVEFERGFTLESFASRIGRCGRSARSEPTGSLDSTSGRGGNPLLALRLNRTAVAKVSVPHVRRDYEKGRLWEGLSDCLVWERLPRR